MRSILLLAVLVAGPAAAQDAGTKDGPPKRVRSILLYGDEKCPPAQSPEEVVVCADAGDSPYRIPKRFRNQPDEGAAAQAWTNRVESVEEFNRAGLPNSCSPVGSGGQTGCSRAAIRQWYQERLDQKAKAARTTAPQD
ncbi:hypothetical protein E5A73_19065 [Sphingomonas gei]|uniref:DUF4124 domain-containing protein n=1 Tax=Sphingomonas gei TaxID=1395960 RepID=A0A4S1X2Q3_9SPHN|nr:hypothetical protein [Sphingomonas gei]TGX49615.1 hypothetical protein E5A73_19065 [Sphingomonas gei]